VGKKVTEYYALDKHDDWWTKETQELFDNECAAVKKEFLRGEQ